MPKQINICNVHIDSISMGKAIEIISHLAIGNDSSFVVTPNVDHIMKLNEDKEFREVYKKASLVLPDGMPLLWAGKFLGTPLKEKISGSDLFPRLCEVSAEKGHKLFFLGGRPGAALKASEVLKTKYPKLNIVGIYSPPFGFENNINENEKIIKMINDARPDILFVGLGAPKQEKWIYKYSDKCNVPVSIGIGVTFEFVAGMVKRAPIWMQNNGLEWFWRLMMEPGRLWKRYLVDDMKFFWLMLKYINTAPDKVIEINKKFSNIKILNVKFNNFIFSEAVDVSFALLQNLSKSSIYFLNADCIYKAQKDIEYRNILNQADLVLPDGIGLKLVTKLFGGRMKDNCNGSDFSPVFMERAAEAGYKIFFLGGMEGVAEKAAENFKKKIPGIRIVGTNSGYFNNDEEIINKINGSGADILFVAMGVPAQEKWIFKNREKLNPKLCLGVGALFDYISGRIKRAPEFMRALRLEWLWRLFMEPRRMFKRYIIDGARFFFFVFKVRLTGNNSITGESE